MSVCVCNLYWRVGVVVKRIDGVVSGCVDVRVTPCQVVTADVTAFFI